MSSSRPLVSQAGAGVLESRVMYSTLVGECLCLVRGVLPNFGGCTAVGVLGGSLDDCEGVSERAKSDTAQGNTLLSSGCLQSCCKLRPWKAVLKEIVRKGFFADIVKENGDCDRGSCSRAGERTGSPDLSECSRVFPGRNLSCKHEADRRKGGVPLRLVFCCVISSWLSRAVPGRV